MTGVERALDERFDPTQAGGLVDDVQVAHERECGLVTSLDDEGNHS